MQQSWIKNFEELATTENRKITLEIMESGLSAINTEKVIESSVSLIGNILVIEGKEFNLAKFRNIKVVGFGKSSCEAALALEKILGSKINEGAVIGLNVTTCEYIETFSGTHPRPSKINTEASKKIYEIIKNSKEDDLIIVLISGGGSALLCSTDIECEQGIKLYDAFLKSNKTIAEINTVRKHLSLLKGGGLVKIAYPATIVGLIFSDIPGDDFKSVASGPTYKDETTIEDAKKIITENNLGDFNLLETPKEDKYFDKVHNFVLVSNKTAIEAMAKKARELNLSAKIVSTELYDEVDVAIKKIFSAGGDNTVVFAAGEPRILVPKDGGRGGRNLHLGLLAIKNKMINKNDSQNSVFISFASDGMDNSDVAGAVVDKNTIEKADKLLLNVDDYLSRFDSYSFFQKIGGMIITGPTGANVSDLMILLTKNGK
ncbi:MAG: Glycerate 2-kinase [Candidatus Nomurabacteria bacterium GW2011_GWB1_40_7]|uniref:Glycerate 2-kinase n=1 Tax=Candidatus Nomurabacteria bacterium GW2011_GWB1_40_7 TaxID=1618744 RepID=A0A0G0W5L5_9BACT|nr:MAG: Glycerate 2-kinase [Candidatus Nomurabacteria bacterium GW2011_GWB1_40_7]